MKDFFSVQEISKLLKISRSTVLYYIKTDRLKAAQVGKVYIISREHFGEFLKDQRNKRKDSEGNQTHLDF